MNHFTAIATLVLFVLIAPAVLSAQGPTMCTMQYDPVCGTKNGVFRTYGNSCELGVDKATYQHAGECTASELNGSGSTGTYVPPAQCTAWFDGCNHCGRSEDGQAYCTLMACMGEPRAGYCTAYGNAQTEPNPMPDRPVSNNDVSPEEPAEEPVVSVEATSSIETTNEGFFARVWMSIRSWFSGLF